MDKPAPDNSVSSTGEPLHETFEPQIRPLAWFLAGLGAAIGIVCAIIWVFFVILKATINETPIERRTTDVAAETTKLPLLQISPRADIDAIRARDKRALHTTAWIDRDRGLARVPIETAMEIVAQDGLPKWPPPAAEPMETNAPQATKQSN
jgi:hypothetical protein